MKFNRMNRILYIVIYLPFIFGNHEEQKETQILIDELHETELTNMNRKAMIITQYFERMIGQNFMLVDKTLFLEKFFGENHTQILITLPQRWGKSVNLKMVQFFAKIPFINETRIPIEETSAYGFFKKGECNESGHHVRFNDPPMVSKNQKFVDENLGKWPVISVDFSGINVDLSTVEKFTDAFESRISKVFRQHSKYILQPCDNGSCILKEDERSLFEKIMCREVDRETFKRSINFLSEVLHKYFGREVLLLIDDYDIIFNEIYYNLGINDTTSNIITFYQDFLTLSLKSNKYLHRALITGVTHRVKPECVNHLTEFNLDTGLGVFLPFYGFSMDEVETLIRYRWPEEESSSRKETAVTWYKGFQVPNHTDTSIFNSWSVPRFIASGKTELYSYKIGDIEKYLLNMWKYLQLRYYIQHLLDFGAILIKNKHDLISTECDLQNVGKVLTLKHEEFLPEKTLIAVFSFLFSFGYLTASPYQSKGNETRLIIPNLEIRFGMNTTYTRFLRQHMLEKRVRPISRAADGLNKFIFDEKDLPMFINNTKILFKNDGPFLHIRSELQQKNDSRWKLDKMYYNQTAIHLLMDLMAHILIMNHEYVKGFEVMDTIKLEENPLHPLGKQEAIGEVPHYFLHTKRHGAIIKFETDPQVTIEKTLERAINYTTILKGRVGDFELVKYIAIKYNEDETLDFKSANKSQSEIETFLATSKAN